MSYDIIHLRTDTANLSALGQLTYDSIHSLTQDHYTPEQRQAWMPKPMTPSQIAQRMGDQHIFIATDEDGYAAYMSLTDDGYIDFAYAHPRASGKGASSQVLTDLEAYAKRKATPVLTSDVSLTAIEFFKRRGFSILKRQFPIKNGVKLENYKVSKSLA